MCAQKFFCGGDPLKLLQDCEGVPFGLREDYMQDKGILSQRISCLKIFREMLIQITVAK